MNQTEVSIRAASEAVAREVPPFLPDAWVDENYTDDHDG